MNDLRRDLLKDWDVVVVDDEDDSLWVAEIILTEYGANVHTAPDGRQGLDLIRRLRPRFVISDLSMPEMDGWGLIHTLKNDHALMDIPVIALTAHAMTGDRDRAIAAGFYNYLTKPLSVDTFMNDLLGLLVNIPALAADLDH